MRALALVAFLILIPTTAPTPVIAQPAAPDWQWRRDRDWRDRDPEGYRREQWRQCRHARWQYDRDQWQRWRCWELRRDRDDDIR